MRLVHPRDGYHENSWKLYYDERMDKMDFVDKIVDKIVSKKLNLNLKSVSLSSWKLFVSNQKNFV